MKSDNDENIAGYAVFTPDPASVELDIVTANLNVSVVSAYAALQEFVTSIRNLSKDVFKTFIYTGNSLNIVPLPIIVHTGVGKAGAANLIEGSALAYQKEGFRCVYPILLFSVLLFSNLVRSLYLILYLLCLRCSTRKEGANKKTTETSIHLRRIN